MNSIWIYESYRGRFRRRYYGRGMGAFASLPTCIRKAVSGNIVSVYGASQHNVSR